ncbi:hypothetical protein jhhlp_003016 [Lomentospora prolificans]|uniref:Ecp2 effector protein domain-containing protein n=1 Tax=Lomentospora prolificans TaxID=41688 RepID=A0A2N3NFR1_9PEZI|nr:hypothetical protein jhhlp_003016 [Lomentospora prolificans]
MFRSILAPLTVLFALAAAAPEPATLQKRCSPWYDEEFYQGYLPPVACWQDQDTACQPYIKEGTEMLLDSDHSLAVIYGISQSCADTIAEELARTADGRRAYGWVENHGTLTVIEGGILVISNMSETAVQTYSELIYYADAEWPSKP